jgi:hypothetical protein
VEAQQTVDHDNLAVLDEHVAHHFAHATAEGDQAAMLQSGLARAIDQVGVRKHHAVDEERGRHHDLVAEQHAQQAGGRLGQVGQAAGDLLPLVSIGFAQHVQQQVGGDRPLERRHPGAGQAHDIGQPPQQRATRPPIRRIARLICDLVRRGVLGGVLAHRIHRAVDRSELNAP